MSGHGKGLEVDTVNMSGHGKGLERVWSWQGARGRYS